MEFGFIVTCPHPQGSLSSTVSYLRCTSYTFLTLSLRRHCFSELCRPPMALLSDGKFSERAAVLLSTGSSSHSSPQGVPCPTCAHSTCTLASRLPLPLASKPTSHTLLAVESSRQSLCVYLKNFPDSLQKAFSPLSECQTRNAFSRTQPPSPSSPEHLLRVCGYVSGQTFA